MALVEEVVHYTGENGVHFHHAVVRKMVGGPDGVSLEKSNGNVTAEEALGLDEVIQSLKKYLDDYEANSKAPRKVELIEKKHEVDPTQLAVVAFVTNDETKEVVQAAYLKLK
jgi:hypothetical protein